MQINNQDIEKVIDLIVGQVSPSHKDGSIISKEEYEMAIRVIDLIFKLDQRADKYAITLWSRSVYQQLRDVIASKVEK